MMSDWPERLDRFVEALRLGRRPESKLARTSEEVDDLRMAAKIAGSRPEFANPDPAFMQRLREQIGANRPAAPRVSRSRVVRTAGLWVAAVAGGFGLDRVWLHFQTPPTAVPEPAPAGGHWHPVAQLKDLVSGVATPVTAGGVPAFVIRDGDNVRALSRVCTHMGCLLQFSPAEGEFQCPCHGALFDLQGRPDSDYSSFVLPPLPAMDVRVVNGTVYLLGA